MNGKIYRAEEDTRVAKEAMEKAREEAAQAKEEATKVEEDKKAADDNMVLLTEHIRKLMIDLATAKESYARIKAELLGHVVVQGAAEENEKKAREVLEQEKTRSHSLSDNVESLKKVIREKEDTIIQSGKLIVDLRVEKMEAVHWFKRIERDNTNLVGENMNLHEQIHDKRLSFRVVLSTYSFFVN